MAIIDQNNFATLGSDFSYQAGWSLVADPSGAPGYSLTSSPTTIPIEATCSTADGNSGNAQAKVDIWWSSATTVSGGGIVLFLRSSNINGTYNFYSIQANLFDATNSPASSVVLGKYVGGIQTSFNGTVTNAEVDNCFSTGGWYTVQILGNGTTIQGTVQRKTDGAWLTQDGHWSSSHTVCLQAIDTTFASSGYAGFIFNNPATGAYSAVVDNWLFETYTRTIYPVGINEFQAFGLASIRGSGASTPISPAGFRGTALGTPTLKFVQRVNPSGAPSTVVFGAASLHASGTAPIAPLGFRGTAFGLASVHGTGSVSIAPLGFRTTTFGLPYVVNAYSRRLPITVPSASVQADLPKFYLSLKLPLPLGTPLATVKFEDQSGNTLASYLVSFGSGTLDAIVKTPLSAETDTTLYMYF